MRSQPVIVNSCRLSLVCMNKSLIILTWERFQARNWQFWPVCWGLVQLNWRTHMFYKLCLLCEPSHLFFPPWNVLYLSFLQLMAPWATRRGASHARQRIWTVSATTAACKQLEGDKVLKYEETTPTPPVKAQVTPLPEIVMNKCRVCEPWVADLEFTVKGSQAFKPGGWLCRDNKRITSKKSLCFVCSDFTQPALHRKYFIFKPVSHCMAEKCRHPFVFVRILAVPLWCFKAKVKVSACAPAKQGKAPVQILFLHVTFIVLKVTSQNS